MTSINLLIGSNNAATRLKTINNNFIYILVWIRSGGFLLVDLVVCLVTPVNTYSLLSSGMDARLRWYVLFCAWRRLLLTFFFGRVLQLKYL